MKGAENPVIVTRHAVEAYARRRVDRRSWFYIAQEIQECVEIAFEEGHVFNYRPEGFVLYGRRKSGLPPEQFFVQCNTDSNYGFIVKRDLKEGQNVVITTLTRAGVRR